MKKLVYVLSFLFLIFFVGCSSENTNTNDLLDTYQIKSESMEPEIMLGAMVKVNKLDEASDYSIDDYIMVKVYPSNDDKSLSIEIATSIIDININQVDGVNQYSFVVGPTMSETTSLVSFEDVLGKIVEINNP